MHYLPFDGFLDLFGRVLLYLSTNGFSFSINGMVFDITYLNIAIGAFICLIGIAVIHHVFDW